MPRQNQKPLQEPESNKSLDAARVISSPSQCLRSQKPSAVKAKCSQPSISLSQVIEPLTRAKTIAKQKISEPSFSVSLDYLISETKSGFPVFSKRPNEKPITKQQPIVNFPTEVLLSSLLNFSAAIDYKGDYISLEQVLSSKGFLRKEFHPEGFLAVILVKEVVFEDVN